jgi:predicted enzyme related to lactoylglutathione lyase
MAAFAEGTPCWVDASLPDVEAGKRFYGELFGWTFTERGGGHVAGGTRGRFADAFSDGRLVGALTPKRDGRMPTVWGVYFATPDAKALGRRIADHGGRMINDPLPVDSAGISAVAADPGGAVFGLWQAGTRQGFEKQGEPNSFCWTEVYTQDHERADDFYESVFHFQGTDLTGTMAGFRMWSPAGTEPGESTAVGGRSAITDEFPPEMPDHFLVYFCVTDCDATAESVVRLGGRVRTVPSDTPYGRIAVFGDNQGATFAVLAEPDRSDAPGGTQETESDGTQSESGRGGMRRLDRDSSDEDGEAARSA